MATTWEVQSTTKNNVTTSTAICSVEGTVVATITGLKEGLTPNEAGDKIHVDTASKTISLEAAVLGKSNVAISTNKSYSLGFYGTVPGGDGIEITPTAMTVKNGTVTVTGTLKEGYTLNAKKTGITYSAEKTNQVLAQISGLNTALKASSDGSIAVGTESTTGEGESAVTTFTPAVTLNGNTITLTQDALKDAAAKLTLKNGAAYTIALDSVAAPQIEAGGAWAVTNKGVATYTGNTTKGHTLSLDGKTVNFTAVQESKTLVKITGVNKDADLDSDFSIETVSDDAHYAAKVTLAKGALTTGNVTISTGYQLAINDEVSHNPEATNNIWAVNKTTATYKQVTPAYYSYDSTKNSIIYNKQADIQTYATVTGLKSGLPVTEGSIEGITLGTLNEGEFEAADNGKVIQLSGDVLTTTNVAVTGTGYTLTLDDDVDSPETANEIWSVSGTTATLKGNITAGYSQTSDTTINYVKKATNATLATVKGLGKGLTVSAKNTAENTVGTSVTEGGETTFTAGLVKEDDTITLSNNVLGTTNVTLTPATGFKYTLSLDDGTGAGGAVSTSNKVDRTFWYVNGSSLELKGGKEAYYTPSDDKKTVTYTAPIPGDTLLTLKGLRTDLKVGSDYDISGISINGNNIFLSKSVLNQNDVTSSGSKSSDYNLKLDESGGSLAPSDIELWSVDNNIAYLKSYKSEGYVVSNGKKITYSAQDFEEDLAEISGLKNGLKVAANGTITGITVDGDTITLAKGVLGTTDVVLTNDKGSYTLGFAAGVAESTTTGKWTSATAAGKAVYQVTTPAGFVLDADKTTATYNKKSTLNLTITGLNSVSISEGEISGIYVDLDDKKITLGDSVLKDRNVTLAGNGYTLALDGVATPQFEAGKWTIKVNKNVATATLNGTVETAGYQVSADGKTVNYFKATDADADPPETAELATITGLNGNIATNADETAITGITPDNKKVPTKFTLSKDVLGTSKVTVSGGNYTLDLATTGDDAVPTTVEKDAIEWVTSGTTATFKKYDKGFYTLDDTGSSISYTADTKGTTYATLKGFVSGTDINNYYNTLSKTVTLNADQLGTSKVTLTGTGYKLALGNAPTSASPTIGWVTSGTTATYKNYTPGYYKLSGNTINYTAATKGTTIATIKGLKSGAEITAGASKEIELNASQLGTSKVTISGDGYTLKLADDVQRATPATPEWNTTDVKNKSGEVTSVTAAYVENISPGYALANPTTITYSATEKPNTLATIKGLAPEASLDDDDDGKGTDSEIEGITVSSSKNSSGKYEITLSDTGLLSNKVTLTSTDYALAMGGEVVAPAEDTGARHWVIGMKSGKPNGTATYKTVINEGYTLSADAKTLTKVAENDNKTLLTLSGLNTTALAELVGDGNTYNEDLEGITVNDEDQTVTFSEDTYLTKKVTLGKNDPYAFVLDGVTEPTAYTNPKWSVSTVKSTTKAVLKDGMEAGYALTNDKTIALVAEKAGDTLATLNGLVKGLKVSDDKQSLYFTNSDGTTSTAVSYTKTNKKISLLAPSLGTSDITLESDTYTIGSIPSGVSPKLNAPAWTFNNGTATYAEVQEKGYTLAGDNKSVSYTAPKTTTIATITGLDKTFSGDANDYLSVSNKNVVSVSKDILGTSKVAISVPKNSAAYTLALANGVPEQPNRVNAAWVTNGTTAQYKDYDDAYYLVATGNKAINYVKPKDVKVYATIKGLASGTTIDSSTFSGNTSGGTIMLTDDMLTNSHVTLSMLKGTSFTLALDDDVKQAAGEEDTGWYNEGTKATYGKYINSYYTANAAGNKITYTKGKVNKAYATITGTTSKITAELYGDTFTLNGNAQLSKKVTVDGKVGDDIYAFKFDTYSAATITGSAKADKIEVTSDNLSISTGNGDDTINVSGAYVTINSGAGNDSIDVTESEGNNVFVFAKNQGADTIAGFKSTDAITASGAKAEIAGDDIVVKIGTDTVTLQNAAILNTIMLNGKVVTPTDPSSANLLADNNYSMDAAQLSSIVNADLKSYSPYDFSSNFSLTKEESFTPEITFTKDK